MSLDEDENIKCPIHPAPWMVKVGFQHLSDTKEVGSRLVSCKQTLDVGHINLPHACRSEKRINEV